MTDMIFLVSLETAINFGTLILMNGRMVCCIVGCFVSFHRRVLGGVVGELVIANKLIIEG